MKRREFLRNGLKGTVAYTLLPAILLGSQSTMAEQKTATTGASENEIEYLLYMREEEKLARDVYLTMYDTWGNHVFANIADSEQTHTLAVKAKLEKYGIDDPVLDDDVGIFINQKLATLYETLVEQGSKSEMDALWVGGAIEEIDMIDLQEAIDDADHPDIAKVYQNLMDGSKNHLRAFVAAIEAKGMEYSAQYISQEKVDEILNG